MLVDGPHVPHHEIAPLSPDELRRLLEIANGQRLEALYTVLLLCGLRLGEALALSWDEIDFAERRLTVRRSLARIGRSDDGGSKLVLQEPKTARARRVLHLPDRVATVLRTHRARQASERLALA
jgi:integrase